MPLGNNSYNKVNRNQEDYSPSVYSPTKFVNGRSEVDKSTLSIAFWKGMLKISISPIIENGDGSVKYDKENTFSVYLTPNKARLFYHYVVDYYEKYKNNDEDIPMNIGVNTGASLVYITNGTEEFAGKTGLYIVIKGIDEQGNITSSIAYEFSVDTSQYFGVMNYRGDKNFSKDYTYTNSVEIESFINIIKNYLDSSGGSYGASAMDAVFRTLNTISGRLISIQDNLGIDSNASYGSKKRANNNSYFANNGNGSSSSSGSASSSDHIDSYDAIIEDM